MTTKRQRQRQRRLTLEFVLGALNMRAARILRIAHTQVNDLTLDDSTGGGWCAHSSLASQLTTGLLLIFEPTCVSPSKEYARSQ